jgi:hypothetical protein
MIMIMIMMKIAGNQKKADGELPVIHPSPRESSRSPRVFSGAARALPRSITTREQPAPLAKQGVTRSRASSYNDWVMSVASDAAQRFQLEPAQRSSRPPCPGPTPAAFWKATKNIFRRPTPAPTPWSRSAAAVSSRMSMATSSSTSPPASPSLLPATAIPKSSPPFRSRRRTHPHVGHRLLLREHGHAGRAPLARSRPCPGRTRSTTATPAPRPLKLR